MFDPMKKKVVTRDDCFSKYGVYPEQFTCYQSLLGDSADNVPGVKGVGAKTAMALIQQFDNLDNIYANIEDIVKSSRGMKTRKNTIEYNYWSKYAGFDRDGDNIGDNKHQIYQYADQLWHYNHKIKFFYASPVMSLMNFLSQLAPFVEPVFLLEDTKPVFKEYNQRP